MLLRYKYEMNLEFSQPVTDQHFAIRCVPMGTARQSVIESNVRADAPLAGESSRKGTGVRLTSDTDGLGNPYVYGLIREAHSLFCLVSEGAVETGGSLYEEYEEPGSVGLWRYRVESPFTAAGPSLRALHAECLRSAPGSEINQLANEEDGAPGANSAGDIENAAWRADAAADPYNTMLHFSSCVHAALDYVSGSTDVSTTAEEAVVLGHGVCQDYAHVLIALLRLSGIPARYVVGMIPGEGETHAWVEANCRGYWYGIDPTNNALVDERYIKFSHGRDYADCMISRGIFTNPNATQRTQAGASVQQVEQ